MKVLGVSRLVKVMLGNYFGLVKRRLVSNI